MRKMLFMLPFLLVLPSLALNDPIERWAKAVGGREKIAAIKSVYREATLEFGQLRGTIKVWHTADGKYRKEEQIATFSVTEVFDGVKGTVQQGAEAPRPMTAAELTLTRSRRFANSNAMFFVFFPERHRGSVTAQGQDSIVFKPDGGIEWRVTLDPQTSLPRTMVHGEGERTVTVTFNSYETVDGIKFENEIHRSAGDRSSIVRFTKTVINPQLESSLFLIQDQAARP